MDSESGRINLAIIKNKLNIVLERTNGSENAGKMYWDGFKKFAQSKLSKAEMDATALALLKTPENIALHNLFIKAILNNVQLPWNGTDSTLKKNQMKQNQFSLNGMDQRKRKSEGKKSLEEKQKEKKLKSEKETEITSPLIISPPSSIESIDVEETPLCEPKVLRDRIHISAGQNGIFNVQPESIQLLDSAIRLFLKNIIQNVHPKHSVSISSGEESTSHPLITVEDILSTVHSNPNLLMEDHSINRERLSLSL